MSNIPANVEVVTPNMIAGQLGEVSNRVFALDIPEEDKHAIDRSLRAAANNIRIMNELELSEGRLIPRNAGELWYLVDVIVKAKAAPSSYENNPATIFLGVQKAMELGIDPIGGLSNIMVVNNRLSIWGDLAQALIQNSGKMEKQVSEKIGTWPDDSHGPVELMHWPMSAGWRVTTWRKGMAEPFVGEFTVADAKRANLWMNTRKQPWITDPTRMLFNRARARSQRDGFADALFGLAIAEEQYDIQRAENVTHAALPAPASVDDDDEPVTKIEAPKETIVDFANFDAPTPEPVPAQDDDEPETNQSKEGE